MYRDPGDKAARQLAGLMAREFARQAPEAFTGQAAQVRMIKTASWSLFLLGRWDNAVVTEIDLSDEATSGLQSILKAAGMRIWLRFA